MSLELLPRAAPGWRAPDSLVVLAVWALLSLQQLAVSLSRPKRWTPITEGAQEVPVWAATLTTATNGAVLLVALVVLVLRWRSLPWGQWPLLTLALVPWAVVVARLVVLDRPPGPLALVYPAIVVALWAARPRLEVVEILGYLTMVTALLSIALGALVPWAGIYERAEGAELEKPVGPFGVLAGIMLSGNDLALVLVLGLPAVLVIRRLSLRVGGLVVLGLALVWSASRTAWGAAVLVVVVALVLRFARGTLAARLSAVGLAGLGLLVLALPWLVSAPSAFNNRGALWQFSRERFAQEPWLGWGADIFKLVATTEDNLGGHASHAHNLAAQVLVSGGVLLVVATAALLVLAAVRAVRDVARGWAWGVLFLAALLVMSSLEVPFVTTDRIRLLPAVAVPLLVLVLAQRPSSSSSSAE